MTTTTAFIVLCGALLVNGAFLRRPQLDGRIMGGTDADIEDYPYQVSLRAKKTDYHLCGATIIAEDLVMTSAGCVYDAQIESILFRAGSNLLNKGGSLHKAEEVAVHENYNSGFDDYDLGVVKVDPPFIFGPRVQPIGLADTEPAAGEGAVITGWGTDIPTGSDFKDRLQVANVLISDRKECGDISPRLICVRATEDGKDICYGDNGGPLVVGGKLAGIASTHGCGSSTKHSTFANVAKQRGWIQSIAGI